MMDFFDLLVHFLQQVTTSPQTAESRHLKFVSYVAIVSAPMIRQAWLSYRPFAQGCLKLSLNGLDLYDTCSLKVGQANT